MAPSRSLCPANRRVRGALVTLGLVGAGATFGALSGAVALAVSAFIVNHEGDGLAFVIGALLGAPLGAVIAPVVSLLLLRKVPLGRMFVVCSIGTAIGGIIASITAPPTALASLGGALIGCFVAAITLRYRARRLEA